MEASLSPIKGYAVALPSLDRVIRGILLVYIFSLPFKGLLFIERNGFLLLLVLLVFWCATNRRLFFERNPIDLPLIAFVVWVGLTVPFATYPLYSLQEYGKLLQQCLLFYVVLFFFLDQSWRHSLVRFLVAAAALVSLHGIGQFDPTSTVFGSKHWLAVKSFLPSEVWLVTYLTMMIPFSFALAWYEERPWAKGLYGLVVFLAIVCLLLTQSRAGLVSFLVALWSYVWFLKRRAMLVIAGTITTMLIVAAVIVLQFAKAPDGNVELAPQIPLSVKTTTTSFVHRIDIWTFMAGQIAEHPLVGIGYGKETSKMLYGAIPEEGLAPGHFPVRKHGTHNILLELALLVGLPGMLLFVWLAVRLARTLFTGYRLAEDAQARAVLLGVSVGFIGMAVRLQFDQMLVGTLAIQFWVLVGIAIAASGPSGASVASQGPSDGVSIPAGRAST